MGRGEGKPADRLNQLWGWWLDSGYTGARRFSRGRDRPAGELHVNGRKSPIGGIALCFEFLAQNAVPGDSLVVVMTLQLLLLSVESIYIVRLCEVPREVRQVGGAQWCRMRLVWIVWA
mgnify:CR=1 FL=1